MKQTLSLSGPLWLDARTKSPLGAVDALESALLKGRGGARRVVVKLEGADVLDAIRDWCDDLDVPYTLCTECQGLEVHLYVLPADFDEHPLASNPRRQHVLRGGLRTPPHSFSVAR